MKPQTTNNRQRSRRRALLAKVHIAKKQLGLDDDLYRMILDDEFRVDSSARLNNAELEQLIRRFESKGFRTKGKAHSAERERPRGQVEALRKKAGGILERAVDDGYIRYPRSLVKKICGVDDLKWCGDAVRLKNLLAVMAGIIEKERITRSGS